MDGSKSIITMSYSCIWDMSIDFQATLCSPRYQRSFSPLWDPSYTRAAASPPGRCREARKAVKMLSWTTWEVSELLESYQQGSNLLSKCGEMSIFSPRKGHPRFTFPSKSDLAVQVNTKLSAIHWLGMRLQVKLDIYGLHYFSMQSRRDMKIWSSKDETNLEGKHTQ